MKNESAAVKTRSFIQLEGSMKAHIISKQHFKFIICADIIVTLIFVIAVHQFIRQQEYSFEQAKKSALNHFVHNQADNICVLEVKSVLKLNMVTNFVSVGVSF